MPDLDIRIVPVMNDNYVYLLRDPAGAACAVVDPGAATPVLEALEALEWVPTHVLLTHHHADHVDGTDAIRRAHGCTVVGARADAARLPGADMLLEEGERIAIGAFSAQVIAVPGHTSGHIAYWFEDAAALFCGDALFSLGCGRMFEGTAGQMWSSLQKLRALPEATRVYCGHEYTQSNAAFAVTVDPDNPALRARFEDVAALRAAGKATIPSTIGAERTANPFLRADDPALQRSLGMAGSDPVAVFADIRARKDRF